MNLWKQITCAFLIAGTLLFAACGSNPHRRSTGEVIDDTAIHGKVKAALINDPIIQGMQINVEVERGVVSLFGAVNGNAPKEKAEEIARGIPGVRAVENHLVVRQ